MTLQQSLHAVYFSLLLFSGLGLVGALGILAQCDFSLMRKRTQSRMVYFVITHINLLRFVLHMQIISGHTGLRKINLAFSPPPPKKVICKSILVLKRKFSPKANNQKNIFYPWLNNKSRQINLQRL